MFSAVSYQKGGDYVPQKYIEEECRVMRYVEKIISPSILEKRELIKYYNCCEDKIEVLPRMVGNLRMSNKVENYKFPLKQIRIIYIASIKNQKNTLDAIRVAEIIKNRGYDVKLYCVGKTQDARLYSECAKYCQSHNLENLVDFVGICNREKLGYYVELSHFNISVAKWETFGRGIYEGMMSYLPTVVLKVLRRHITLACTL